MKNKNVLKVYIYSMGCHRRLLDARKICEYLKINGFKIVKNPRKADYIIFSTCAFKESQEDFAIKKINEFKKLGKKLIVGGCLPKINEKKLEKFFNGPTFTPASTGKINEIFNLKTRIEKMPDANALFSKSIILDPNNFRDLFRFKLLSFFLRSFQRHKNQFLGRNYYVRISWGCLGNCSYCGIKNAIGTLKSKPIKECLAEFKKGLSRGYKSFILLADDLGAYGLDIGTTFPALLKEFLKIEGNYKIYLFEMHPRWVIKYLDDLVFAVKTGNVDEIMCPVQSGSDKILKSMNRFHKAEEIKSALRELRKANPGLKIFTHILIGFPGETEEDFDKTIKLLKDVNFDYTSLYPYSERPNAPAISFPNKVSRQIIEKRIKKAKKQGV